MAPSPLSPTAWTKISLRLGCLLCFPILLGAAGCGDPAPKPLSVAADNVASLDPHVPFLLPANTELEAMNRCVISFPGADLFEPGDVVGEVVVIDNDALIYLGPHNEKIAVTLQRGQSMLITKSRTITVDEADATPCRLKVTRPDGG